MIMEAFEIDEVLRLYEDNKRFPVSYQIDELVGVIQDRIYGKKVHKHSKLIASKLITKIVEDGE